MKKKTARRFFARNEWQIVKQSTFTKLGRKTKKQIRIAKKALK